MATADDEKSAVAAAFLMLYQTERLERMELLEWQYLAEDSNPRPTVLEWVEVFETPYFFRFFTTLAHLFGSLKLPIFYLMIY